MMRAPVRLLRLTAVVLWLLALHPIFGANVTVPSLELFTIGKVEAGTVSLSSEGSVDLLVDGGYKFGGRVVLSFSSSNLEQEIVNRVTGDTLAGGSLAFASASLIIREFFSLPLSFTYFVGEDDIFGSGRGFAEIFGTQEVSTHYSGFFYFPEGIRYDGIHRITGTGMKFAINPTDLFSAAFYLYQDAYFYNYDVPTDRNIFEPGHYSFDFRSLFNFSRIKLEAFLGATYPASTLGFYRFGLLFHAFDIGGEFLAQIGIPRWDPANDTWGLNLIFMLFEARLDLGPLTVIPTVFLHPDVYLQNATSEGGLLDFNLNFRLGDIEKSLFSGGLESNLAFKQQDLQDLQIKVSPYLSVITPGVLWQLRVSFKLFPWDPSDLYEGFVGIEAEF
jgi:hypothetical protein